MDETKCFKSFGFADEESLLCKMYPSSRRITVKMSLPTKLTSVAFKLVDFLNPAQISQNRRSKGIKISIHGPNGGLFDSTPENSEQFAVSLEPMGLKRVFLENSEKQVGAYG